MNTSPPSVHYMPQANGHTSVDELEWLRVELLDQIRGIEAQMSDMDRHDADGRRLSGEEYWAWRKRARHAWQAKQREYAELKQRITEAKRYSGHLPRPAIGEPEQLLGELHKLVRRWIAQDVVSPRPSEVEVIDRVAAQLGRAPVRVAGSGDAG